GEKSYVEEEKFEKNNLKHVFSNFKHPLYPQQFKPFIPNMSVIDLLFNCGKESIKIIKEASGPQEHL
ncbi:WbqC family protein, partial [Patescibacteria group bacterium]|nr:WbqC family protein [Patescibacteria group bacterium]